VAELFQAETGKTFFLARKGDQPVGDVYPPTAGIAVQAKRYTTTRVSETSIEGDIDRALREAPALDVFVVAVTRSLGQLATRLVYKTTETGLDILPLALGDELSEFGALCIAHSGVVHNFIPNLGADWLAWVRESRPNSTNDFGQSTVPELAF
jgi:hypothetical protein